MADGAVSAMASSICCSKERLWTVSNNRPTAKKDSQILPSNAMATWAGMSNSPELEKPVNRTRGFCRTRISDVMSLTTVELSYNTVLCRQVECGLQGHVNVLLWGQPTNKLLLCLLFGIDSIIGCFCTQSRSTDRLFRLCFVGTVGINFGHVTT